MNASALLPVDTNYLWFDVYTFLFGFTRCGHGVCKHHFFLSLHVIKVKVQTKQTLLSALEFLVEKKKFV